MGQILLRSVNTLRGQKSVTKHDQGRFSQSSDPSQRTVSLTASPWGQKCPCGQALAVASGTCACPRGHSSPAGHCMASITSRLVFSLAQTCPALQGEQEAEPGSWNRTDPVSLWGTEQCTRGSQQGQLSVQLIRDLGR